MSETMTVGLTKNQRELLLRGLRFVKSSVALEIREPSPDVVADRSTQLREIASLVEHLEGARPAGTTARV